MADYDSNNGRWYRSFISCANLWSESMQHWVSSFTFLYSDLYIFFIAVFSKSSYNSVRSTKSHGTWLYWLLYVMTCKMLKAGNDIKLLRNYIKPYQGFYQYLYWISNEKGRCHFISCFLSGCFIRGDRVFSLLYGAAGWDITNQQRI